MWWSTLHRSLTYGPLVEKGWRDLGGQECMDMIPLHIHLLESGFWLLFAFIFYLFTNVSHVFREQYQIIEKEFSLFLSSSTSPSPPLLPSKVETILGYLLLLIFICLVGYKFYSLAGIFILQPCHCICLLEAYVLLSSPNTAAAEAVVRVVCESKTINDSSVSEIDSNHTQRASANTKTVTKSPSSNNITLPIKARVIIANMIPIYLLPAMSGSIMALVFPENDDLLLPFEQEMFWIEHWFIVLLPLYLLMRFDGTLIKKVMMRRRSSETLWHSIAIGLWWLLILHFFVHEIISYQIKVNLEFMLCPTNQMETIFKALFGSTERVNEIFVTHRSLMTLVVFVVGALIARAYVAIASGCLFISSYLQRQKGQKEKEKVN